MTGWLRPAIACGMLLLSTTHPWATTNDPDSPKHPPREFYFGIELDPHASDHTRELFFETGMNTVRLTGGGFGWSVEAHKKLADDWSQRGLKVYLQLGSHYPDASYFSLTDAYMVDQDGKPGEPDKKAWAISYSGNAWPQYAYTSAAFRRKLEHDFSAYTEKFAENRNLAGVILHNEPGYFWQTKRLFDYSPGTLKEFRKWLEERDKTIATLNEKWGTHYASFDEVVPPGLPPAVNLASWMDWRHFSVDAVARFMKWEADFFLTLRTDIPRTTNLDGPLNNWYGYRCANLLKYSEPMDRVGIDIYPAAFTTRDFISYSADMVNGVAQGREGHVLECESFSATQWKSFDEKQRAGLLRSELWTLIGHGMRGILLWGFDTFSQPDAKFNDRIMVCRDIASQGEMIGLKHFRREKSKVALCVDPDSYLYSAGIEKKPLELTSDLDHELGGFHAALNDQGIQTDVIFLDQLHSQVWQQYAAIILPSTPMMDEATANELKSFVAKGGILIAGAPLASMDRWAKKQTSSPAWGMDELFGCTVVEARGSGAIATPYGSMEIKDGMSFSPSSASVLGRFADETPGLTSHSFGAGRALLIAGKAGQPFLDDAKSDAFSQYLASLLLEASVRPQWRCTKGGALDLSSLIDNRGNRLIVASLPLDRGKIPSAVTDATITMGSSGWGPGSRAFAFPPTATRDGVVRSGVVPIKIIREKKEIVSFQVGEITSAMPVLLAQDAGPLLAVAAPEQVVNGQEASISITCFNPSPKAVRGEVEVRLRSPVVIENGKSGPLEIPPYERKEVVLKVILRAPSPLARVPLTVVLGFENSEEIKSVPVDIAVKMATGDR